MKLADYQRALVQLSFAERMPEAPELAPFALYRQMIRARLLAMTELAYRRTWSLLGDEACRASCARFLAQQAPASPLIREVIAAFAPFALRDAELLRRAPSHARDLLAFEAAKWRVASSPLPSLAPLRELDFDGVLVVNPTLVLLSLSHTVSELGDAASTHDPHTLLVYRRRAADDVRWYRAPVVLAELLHAQAAASSGATLSEVLRAALGSRLSDPAMATQVLHELSAACTVAGHREVLLGVREPGPGDPPQHARAEGA